MKKISISLIAVATFGLALSCQKEPQAPVGPDTAPETVKTVITAGLDDTKTALQDNFKVYWTDGDAINVNGISSEALVLSEPAASASFSFAGVIADEKKAVYPASAWTSDGSITLPATQAAGTNASFAAGALPMVAYTASGSNLTFKHTMAVLKLRLKQGSTSDEIAYAEFTGNNEEQVSGSFGVNYETGVLSAAATPASADKKVMVTIGKTLSSAETDVYIAVPAATYSNGFTIKIVDVNNVTMTKHVGACTLASGKIYPTELDTFDADGTLKAWAKSFVKGLKVWGATVGNVDADGGHNGKTGWKNVHYIPIGNTNNSDYKDYGNNQYSDGNPAWTFTVGGITYTSSQAWEIAIRGLMNMVTAEGEAFLNGMTDRNKAYTLANNAAFTSSVPSASSANKWGKNPWYENPTVKDGGSTISSVGINFMIKVGSWHVVRSFIAVGSNSPLGMVGNFQEFGTSNSTLKLGSYSGQISPMRELLILMRIYKYLLDNNINENVYTALADQQFDFELYYIN